MKSSKTCALSMLCMLLMLTGACSQKRGTITPSAKAPQAEALPTYEPLDERRVCFSPEEVAELEASFEASNKRLIVLGKPAPKQAERSLLVPVGLSLAGGFLLGVVAVVLGGWAVGQVGR